MSEMESDYSFYFLMGVVENVEAEKVVPMGSIKMCLEGELEKE